MNAQKLELYAFWWSLARLVIAAFSLFFGAVPIAYKLVGGSTSIYGLVSLFWLISGAAAIYLVYLWYKNGHRLFGRSDNRDKLFFLLMVLTGINLGLTSIISANIALEFVWFFGSTTVMIVAKVAAFIYLYTAYYLWNEWQKADKKLILSDGTLSEVPQTQPEDPPNNTPGQN